MGKKQIDDDLSDCQLLRLCGKGNEDAFLVLYRRHQGPLFRFALHMSGSREIADEVVQEVFMTLLSEPKTFIPDRGPLQAYLLGIARNKMRRQLLHNQVPISASHVADENARLLEGLTKKEELAALRQAILSLPSAYREVIVLCDLENLDYAQVASQLSCPVGTVRSRLHRARVILGSKLKKIQPCCI